MVLGWTKSINASRRRNDNDEQQHDDNFHIERKIAHEIMETVERLHLPLKLDQLTEGRGNCFPMSIIQQCHRPEIRQQLKLIPKMMLKSKLAHSSLRYNVRRFILKSEHPRIHEFRKQFEELDGLVNGESWSAYWTRMARDFTWVDYWFVQGTAWYLELDLWIVATSSTESSPYIAISGNLDDSDIPCSGPIITLGTKSNSHYQSLLPIEMLHLEFQNHQQSHGETRQMFNKVSDTETKSKLQNEMESVHDSKPHGTNSDSEREMTETQCSRSLGLTKLNDEKRVPQQETELSVNESQIEDITVGKTEAGLRQRSYDEIQQDLGNVNNNEHLKTKIDDYNPLIHTHNGKKLTFKRMSHDYKMKCPTCLQETRYIIQHLSKGKCQITVNIHDFKKKFNSFKELYIKKQQNKRKCRNRAKQRENDADKVKEQQNKHMCQSMARQRENDADKVKEQQNKRKCHNRAKQREKDADKVKEQQNKHKCQSMARQRENDADKVKEQQNKRKCHNRAKQRENDTDKVKEQQNKHKCQSMAKQRENDESRVKDSQNQRSKLSRAKRKADDPVQLKEVEKKRQEKHRMVENDSDRLQNFKNATKYNAIFICTCCHQRMFQSNVVLYTCELKKKINEKKPGHTEACVDEEIQTKIDGKDRCYICLTCVRHMKGKKIPPMSIKNGLKLTESDKEIREQRLELTELEGALIAKNIIFQKIYQLPKSRWTALKDKVVNVPINEDSILNTIEALPRTPQGAGLIGVALKRKKEYKNSHKNQLINPEKLFRMLDKLKRCKNPHYQFYDDFNTYKTRCEISDPEGFNVVFQDIVHEQVEQVDGTKLNEVIDEIELNIGDEKEDENHEEKEEIEWMTKDPVKKYQFRYNDSLCMTNKYPEIAVTDTQTNINVAPGEGQIPKDIMADNDWDIKAFPHLHNPDGSNGKDQERKVKLTEQNYFINRICNKEQRFAKSPAYVYSAVGYIEKKQINRNINLAGTRGKKVTNEAGGQSYELDDGYRVLEDMKNTPKYWKKAKYEMIARLDNLGPFQLFFTLSCADMRWSENFAAILLERGYEISYENSSKDEDGYTKTDIQARRPGQNWKPIKQFIEEDVEESLHELVRGNVLTATRYFEHRVKQFINKIVMGKNNHMYVKYYTYKVEFQDRGAGHVHGTLWLGLKKIENLIRDGPETELRPKTTEEERDSECRGWMYGLTRAFKRLRHNLPLKDDDIRSLRRFIDEFTTVSTHENTVGKEVAKIAKEVNKHHHTKTCRKHDTTCRFGYPRLPAPYTIIVEPCKAENAEAKKNLLVKYSKILQKVQDVVEDEDAMNKIMGQFDKQTETHKEYIANREARIRKLCQVAEVTYEEYIKALSASKTGYSVVLQRDLDEVYINPYNVEWLRAWDGNMDIQVVLDFFAVITYVTDYYSKDDTGTMEIIKATLAETDSKDLKERMKIIANTFLTHRQMGEAEAMYRLLPSMLLKKSNVACQWVTLGTKDERSSRWKKATQEDIDSGRPVIVLDGHEGYWYEQQDMWSKYLRRPMDTLANICFAQFAKMYRSGSRSKPSDDEPEKESEDNVNDEDDGYNSEDQDDDKFNYIMTHETGDKNDYKKAGKLPECIKLNGQFPGESSIMVKRSYPAVLRFNKTNRQNNPQKFILSELMLYRPVTKEIELDEAEAMYDESHEGKRKTDIVKSQVMEHLEGVEEARYYVEQIKKELDLTEIAEKLDPALEQDNADCDDEVETEHPDFSHIDPGQIVREEDKEAEAVKYKRVEIPSDSILKEKTRSLDCWQREVVNIGIRFAKDIVKARRNVNTAPKPPLYMIHGGAGAGKSAVIDVLAPWMQKILQQEGDNIECPCVVKTAFTGCAASNIDGQTLHGTFGFSFDNKHYSLSDKSRDQKRALMKCLKIVIIDEISMVKADMLYQLDLRLQEITERIGTPFGGLAVFVFGDMMQLRPCMGRYICEEPLNKDFKVTHALSPRWKMFDVILLETNHRQGNDKSYAELLNRLRIGKHTKQDIELLNERTRRKKHKDIKTSNTFIVCKRKESAEINLKRLAKLNEKLITIEAKHHHATQAKYKPHIEKKDDSVATTSMMNKLHLKIGAKVMLIHNIDMADKLTNGQLGQLMGVVKTTTGQIDKLMIKFNNGKVGESNKLKHRSLNSKFPECVAIERIALQYPLRKRGGEAGASATVIQFPVRLAFAITSHKIQGQTIPMPTKVVLDINSVFDDAQAYVMLSRVQQIEQVFILGELDESKLRTSQIALQELHRMKLVSLNTNPTPWLKDQRNGVKIATLNCAGLAPHFLDIECDEHLMKADVIHLIETSVEEQDEPHFSLAGYSSHYISIGNGKGLVTYFKSTVVQYEQEVRQTNMQIVKFTSPDLDTISVYRSRNGHSVELLNHLLQMLTEEKPTLITGDFNMCYMLQKNNRMSQGLEQRSFSQLVNEATQIRGGLIDHAYWKDVTGVWNKPVIERYSPYYSDHDGICTTLTKSCEGKTS